jgi:Phage major capsid protein E
MIPQFSYDLLTEVTNNTRPIPRALLDMFIGADAQGVPTGARYFSGKTLNWDDLTQDMNVPAPYARPCGPGVPFEMPGYQTKSISFPYISISREMCCDETARRLPGTQPNSMSNMQRYGFSLARAAEYNKGNWLTRMEVNIAEIMQTGGFTVDGPGIATEFVDFNRDSSLTVTLAGAALWTSVTADPVGNLKTWEQQVGTLGNTAAVNWLFGANAWAKFANNADVKDKLKGFGTLDKGTEFMRPTFDRNQMQYQGTFENHKLYTCNETYKDIVTGLQKAVVDPNSVYVFGDMQLVPCFGAINHKAANFEPMPYFVWQKDLQKNDSIHLESAPLIVPLNVNGCLAAKVM